MENHQFYIYIYIYIYRVEIRFFARLIIYKWHVLFIAISYSSIAINYQLSESRTGRPRAGRPWGIEDSGPCSRVGFELSVPKKKKSFAEAVGSQEFQVSSCFIWFHLISESLSIIPAHARSARYIGCQPSTKCVVQLVAPRDEVVSAPALPSGTGPPIANWPWVSATNNKSECPI